ncbi:MAG: helix-turn-helix domain-containing protein [Candidatus Parvarchaeota archaeon]|nr:helix-turn-helix domain-containing protein [Candidatus Parvarchaeota archaeon]
MTGKHYTEQEKAKVRALIENGLSKRKASQILGIPHSTIWRWGYPSTFKNKTYPKETKEEAIKLYKSGLSRIQISIKLGVGMRALNHWLGKSRDGREFKVYPTELRQKARQLARSGVPKFEIANILHVCHATVIRWTSDIKENGDRVSGRYFRLFSELINNGFVMLNRKELQLYRILRKYARIKAVAFGKKLIVMVPGKEKTALKAFLGSSESRGMTKRKIGGATRAFLGSAKQGWEAG